MRIEFIVLGCACVCVILLAAYSVIERKKQNERYKRKDSDHRSFNSKRGGK